jgi:hypothetical protein
MSPIELDASRKFHLSSARPDVLPSGLITAETVDSRSGNLEIAQVPDQGLQPFRLDHKHPRLIRTPLSLRKSVALHHVRSHPAAEHVELRGREGLR